MFSFISANAQVDLTATGGTPTASFTTLKGAFDAINAGTHTGSISISISGNTTETASAVLNASGSGSASYTSIAIAPSGGAARTISGAITAGSPLIDLNGADNVTINGLNSGGNSLTISNTTASATSNTSTIRFIGGATNNTITNCSVLGSFSAAVTTNGGNIFFSTDAVTANGNDNNTISFCDIGPAGANLPTKGIYMNGSTTTTALNNSGNTFNGNNIFNYFGAAVSSAGIYIGGGTTDNNITNNKFYQTATRTQTTGAQHSAIWITNSSGNNYQVTGNTIGYSASNGTGTYTFAGVSSSSVFIPIFCSPGTTTASNVSSNTITNIAMSGAISGTTSSGPFRAIYVTGLTNVNSNIIGSQSVTGAITVTSSSTSAGNHYGIYNNSSSNTTISSNQIGGISVANSTTGTVTFTGIFINTSTTATATVNGNTIGGSVANSIALTATSTSSQIVGINIGLPASTVTSNIVRNITSNAGTGTGSTASIVGIAIGATSATHTVGSNTIFNLSNTLAGAATVNGMNINTGTTTASIIEKNLIYDMIANSATASINGINVIGGLATYRNNMIRLGTAGTSATVGMAINGINETTAGTDNFYHNSVYIGGAPTSGALNSFAFQSSITTNTRAYQNNIFVNKRSNSGSTGKHYAIRVGGTAANPAGLTSNGNILFANGTGGFTGLFNAVDQSTIANWRTATGQDAGSFSEDSPFVGATATTPDLHLSSSTATFAEGLGVTLATVTDDFDGQTRSGLTPVDIGADALNGTGPSVVVINSVTASPSTTTLCTAASRTITANITAGGSPITSVTLNYSFNGVPQTPIAMTGGSTTGTSDWTATIPVASPVNASVTWSVSAVDPILTKNTVGTAYQDEPLFGTTATATFTPSTVCSGGTVTLNGIIASPGTRTVGTGTSTAGNGSTDFAAGRNFYGSYWGNARQQWLIRASELTAAGLTPGNLSSLSLTVAALGSPTSLTNFTIKLAQTTATTISGSYNTATLTQVYTSASYTPTVGLNTHAFGTGAGSASTFAWDGTSNIIVDVCFANSVTGSTSATNTFTVPGYASGVNYGADGATGAGACSTATVSNSTTARPNINFSGIISTPVATYSWVDNNTSTVVGTTNPLTITPTAGGTYTVTMTTASGCSTTATTSAVSIQALPSAPIATNGNRCGTGVVTNATVTSTTGLPSPTFRWYAAATGGTALQSSTSASYTTSITTTTTLYVSEFNGTCESLRTPITLTIDAPPTLSVAVTSGNQVNCGTGSFNVVLTATSSDPSMTYSWTKSTTTSVINSGATSAVLDVNVTESTDFVVTGTPSDPTCNPIVVTFPVSVYPLPNATVTTSATGVCPGTSATINSGLSSESFSATCITPQSTLSTPPASAVTLINGSGIQVPAVANANSTSVDDNFWSVPIGFSFNYLGTNYTSVFVSTNGILSFTAGTTSYSFPSGFPSSSSPAASIAVCARDLHFTAGSTGVLRYWVEGNAPNRKFIVQYSDVNTYDTRNNTAPSIGKNSAEAVFYETLGNVDIRVIQASNAGSTVANSINKLIGLQNAAQTVGAVAPRCSPATANYWNAVSTEILAPQAWRFTPPANYTITWSSVGPGNVLTPIQTGTNIFTLAVAPTVTTTYDLRYTNQTTGCSNLVDSDRVTMTILNNVAPSTTAIATATSICLGGSSTLSLNGAVNSIGNSDGLTYQWQVNTGSGFTNYTGTGATTASIVVSPTVASTYQCLVAVCNGTAVASSPVSVGFTNNVDTVTNATRCGAGVVTLSATTTSPGATLNWYAAATGGTALATGTSYSPTVTTTTTFYVAAETTGPACSSPRVPVTATVTTNPNPVVLSTSTVTACSGVASAVVTLTGGVSPAYDSYVWSPSTGVSGNAVSGWTFTATANTTYTLTATQTSGDQCTSSATLTVNVVSANVTSSAVSSTICINNSTTLNASSLLTLNGPTGLVAVSCTADNSGGGGSSPISSVVFGSINHTPTVASPYYNLNAPVAGKTTTILRGQSYPLTVSSGAASIASVWIDFDRNGVFDASEFTQLWTSASTGTVTITVPTNATLGDVAMRIRTRGTGSSNGSADACTQFFSGTTEDYTITIVDQSDATSSYTYAWTSSPAGYTGTGSSVTVSPLVTTTYTVTATSPLGCIATSNVTVNVNGILLPAITGASNAMCLGNGTLPLFNGVAQGTWASSNTSVASIGQDGVVTALLEGSTVITYSITDNGCPSSVSYPINVYSPVQITSQPSGVAILTNSNTSFSVSATGSGLTYQWYYTTDGFDEFMVTNDAMYSGATSNTLSLTSVPNTLNGYKFYCKINGMSPCAPVTSNFANLNVGDIAITTQPQSVTLCNSGQAVFTVAATGTSNTYQWYQNDGIEEIPLEDGGDISGATTDTLTINNADNSRNTFTYYVVISGSNSVQSNVVTLNIATGVSIENQPVNTTVCRANGSATFSVDTAGTVTSVQWQTSSNGTTGWTNVGGASFDSFNQISTLNVAILGSSPVGTTYYRAIVNVDSPCVPVTSNVVSLTVQQPTITVTPSSAVYCTPGNPVTLTANGAVSYTWSPATGLSSTTGASVTATPSTTTTYTVTGTDALGCVNSTTVTISIAVGLTASATASETTVCSGGTTQLTANGSTVFTTPPASSYIFSNTTGTLADMTGATVIGSAANDDTPYAASNIGFTFNFDGSNYTQFSASPDGFVRLGGTTAGSQFTNDMASSTNVPKLAPFWDDLALGGTGLGGNILTKVFGTAPNRYCVVEWNVTVPRNTLGSADSKFQLWMYESSSVVEFRYGTVGTTGGASIGIRGATTFNNVDSVDNNTTSTTVATNSITAAPVSGSVYRFTPAGSPTYTYAWTSNPAGFTSSLQSPTVNPTVATTYTVTVYSGTGCSNTASVLVNVESDAVITTQPVASTSICQGGTFTLSVAATGPGLTYQWRLGGNNIPGATNATYTVTNALVAQSGSYDVVVTPSCGNTATSNAAVVTVNPTPALTAPAAQAFCFGATTSAVALTGTPSGVTFDITGGTSIGLANQTGVTQIPAFTPTATGAAFLTITPKANGCTGSPITLTYVINPQPSAVSITPSSATVCQVGTPTQLTASSTATTVSILTGNGTVLNSLTTYPSPLSNYYGGTKHQMLYLASELTALGFKPGDKFSGMSIDAAAVGSTFTGVLNNFRVQMGHTTATSLTSTSFVGSLTNVRAAANLTVGTTGFPKFVDVAFSSTFTWDGTSNVVVQTSYSNANSGASTDGVQTNSTATSFVSTNWYYADNATVGSIFNATTPTSSGSVRPNIKFTRESTPTYQWTSTVSNSFTDATGTTFSNTATGASVYVRPNTTATVTATAVLLTTCSISTNATITVTPAITWYVDADADGFGNAAVSQLACTQPTGYVSNNLDCNDAVASINPGAVDVCYDGIDNDCNGNIDNIGLPGGCTPVYSLPAAGVPNSTVNYGLPLYTTYVAVAQAYR
ncbi:MAG: hypothetical protein EWV88_05660, partial [Microcystis wesenbergii Mw_MB_S_20031200_S109D]